VPEIVLTEHDETPKLHPEIVPEIVHEVLDPIPTPQRLISQPTTPPVMYLMACAADPMIRMFLVIRTTRAPGTLALVNPTSTVTLSDATPPVPITRSSEEGKLPEMSSIRTVLPGVQMSPLTSVSTDSSVCPTAAGADKAITGWFGSVQCRFKVKPGPHAKVLGVESKSKVIVQLDG
jgi:hypothetical protein